MVDKGCSIIERLETFIGEEQQDDDKTQQSDQDAFCLAAKECAWPNLFGQFYMGIDYEDEAEIDKTEKKEENEGDTDDMLFYVQCNLNSDVKQEVKVFRKNSPNLPGLGDPHVNWEESVYLNMIMHDLKYTLTCAICVRLDTGDLKVLSKKSLNLHASHHMRRMDSKGESADLSYPNIFFLIDCYEEVFESLSVQEGEIVCVELTARFKETDNHFVIFLGSVKYEALLAVYHSKVPMGSKMMQKMSFSWMGGDKEHFEYIRMRGPHGKGYAEIRIGLCRNDMVEHKNINSVRDHKMNNLCTCKVQDNVQIYNPTTTLPKTCQKCNGGGGGGNGTVWSNTVKWFQQKKTSNTTTLSPNLTYVTLPWSRIMRDVLQVRQKPVFFKESANKH